MAEFREVINVMNRMCASFPHACKGCPLADLKQVTCGITIKHFPEEVEKRIMQWAKEHPVKTNGDKFEEVFGIKVENDFCPMVDTVHCVNQQRCTDCEYNDFWKQEYKEPGNSN